MDALQAAIRLASAGLDAQSQRMRVVSENIANAHSAGRTPGADPYQRKTISFTHEIEAGDAAPAAGIEIGVDRAPFRSEHAPGHPAADAKGYVKLPNVDLMLELADMREAQRSYMANVQMIKQSREMVAMTIDLLRSGS